MIRHLVLALTLLSITTALDAAQFTLDKDDAGVTVKCDGQLFTRYLLKSGTKPILFPIIGPTGKEMTRGYPMRPAIEGEKDDHIHHRSFWFNHGSVNGLSFWDERGEHGTIEHRDFLELKDGSVARIRTRNDWVGIDKNVVCQDIRTLTFGADPLNRWIDFDVTVTATNGPVVFGDTKEGSFGIRVAGTMKVDLGNGGRIINSAGQTDREAWGQRAEWVDYSGPVDDETVGIAVLNHPKSLRHPTYWHVRTYGLFAANPFGVHDFPGSEGEDGSLTLQKGESFSMYYRVIFHPGDEKTGEIADAYQRYTEKDVTH